MSKKENIENIENLELEPIEDDELDEVTGGKGFAICAETVIGGNNKIKSNDRMS
jgi:hypothetical protein